MQYMAASAWPPKKRFTALQASLLDAFGHVIVLYGISTDAKREIASKYKRKLGPGVLCGAMFASYLSALVAERAIVPSTIQDVSLVKNATHRG
ncbi:hypothetical protein BWQ96_08551 [Gracilariopsis chorda]|uniref:Uncharacterized protein n=1 Tax=Gracilariopsis chorda TaxID=448386 RepID=A0A2V3II25_9FLOR|nr:hypothetical protein BWQ96_08551 [Gracilariopsis chorda]|eukprot:PXF41721.1 hypothetical protein BWQ96_08551 [Gracilariopsis chorda]